MNKSYRIFISIFIIVIFLFCRCSNDTEPVIENTIIGTVINQLNQKPIYPAYIIYNNELLATTNEDGSFEITSLKAGEYSLICSAVNFSDKVMQVNIEDGQIVKNDFILSPDYTMGELIGEFQDKLLLDEIFINDPTIAEWDEEKIFDGVTGATIQKKNKPVPVVMSHVYLGDSLLVKADDYGQYWFEIQSGTYPITVVSEGYYDQLRIVKVESDSMLFINFILDRK